MIDFNFAELGLLIVLAIVIFGPDKLPELARKTARIIAYLRRIGDDAVGQLRQELGPEYQNIQLSDLNPKTFVQRHLLSGDEIADLRQIRNDAKEAGSLVKDSVTDANSAVTNAVSGTAVSSDAGATTPRKVPFDPEST